MYRKDGKKGQPSFIISKKKILKYVTRWKTDKRLTRDEGVKKTLES